MEDLTFGEQVKIILGRKGMTIKELAETIEAKTGKKMSRQNLTQRLGRDNFQEQDMRMIARILECPFQLSIMGTETARRRARQRKTCRKLRIIQRQTRAEKRIQNRSLLRTELRTEQYGRRRNCRKCRKQPGSRQSRKRLREQVQNLQQRRQSRRKRPGRPQRRSRRQ